jgi:RimJ/RimL family protein N-acetyltransferase
VTPASRQALSQTSDRQSANVIILDTDRLTLRQLTIDDADFMLGLLNEPSFLHFIGDRGVRTADEARNYLLTGPIDSYNRFGFGLYLVELKDSAIPIGTCGLLKREALEDVDIGFAFLPAFWSKGYAYEAAAAVVAYARDVVGLKRIVAIVSTDNDRSRALLGKLGLHFERMITWPDDGSEIELYAVG